MAPISIVASMYNSRSRALEVIERLFFPSVLNNASSNKQLILLDDGSVLRRETQALVDEYLPDFRRKFGDVHYLVNSCNMGIAGSYNRGMKIAEGDCIIVANDDIYFPQGSVDALSTALFEEENSAMLGPVTNYIWSLLGPITNYSWSRQNVGRLFPRLKDFSQQELNRIEDFARCLRESRCSRLKVKQLPTFCAALRKTALEAVGYLDERFRYAYYEDVDLCSRLGLEYDLILDTSIFIEHGGPEGGSVSILQSRSNALFYLIINGWKFARKHSFTEWLRVNIASQSGMSSGRLNVSRLIKQASSRESKNQIVSESVGQPIDASVDRLDGKN